MFGRLPSAKHAVCSDRSKLCATALAGDAQGGGSPSPKELLPRTLQFSRLRSRFFFDGYQFVAKLVCLPFEFCFEAFLPLGVALRPKRRVVFDLPLHHRVENHPALLSLPRGASPCPPFP